MCKNIPKIDFDIPEEIVYYILRYLDLKDILNLCISKNFLLKLLNIPGFVRKLNLTLNHLICQTYIFEKNSFFNTAFIPFIINNTFFIGTDICRIKLINKMTDSTQFNIWFCKYVLLVFHYILNPYSLYQNAPTFSKSSIQQMLNSVSKCNILCGCLNYHYYEFINLEYFMKDIYNTKYFRKGCCHLF